MIFFFPTDISDDKWAEKLGGSPLGEDDGLEGFDVDFAAVFQLANTKKEDRFKVSLRMNRAVKNN